MTATKIRKKKKVNVANRPGGAVDEAGSKEVLLETALGLFSTRGYKGTSIRDIANELGISVSNIYHYFGNKEGLWLEIIEYAAKSVPVRLRKAVMGIDDPLARFKALILGHLEVGTNHQRELSMIFIDLDRLSASGAKLNDEVQREVIDIYMAELESLRAAGYVATPHLKILAFNILGVINWQLRWFKSGGKLSADEIHRELLKFVLYGLSFPPDA